MKTILSFYTLKLPIYYVYMLQQVEYEPKKYSEWIKRILVGKKVVQNVMHRQTIVYTKKAKLLVFSSYLITIFSLCILVYLSSPVFTWWISFLIFTLLFPLIIYVYLWVVATLGFHFFVLPRQKQLVDQATEIFSNHKGIKIAVLGSYGKTTMKELLATVLSESKEVAYTPDNKNVSVSHARFAKKLTGNEDVIIVEFGEAAPGDIARMANMLKPSYAIITGLAPNHLDHYDSVEDIATDFLSIYDFVPKDKVYLSAESEMLKNHAPNDATFFSIQGFNDWSVKNVYVDVDKIRFKILKGMNEINIESRLVGRHQIAPITLVAVIAQQLGLSDKEIETGIKKCTPFKHRMQPRAMAGAWLIDDTYNGNIEGMIAGLNFLKELKNARKWYVTPGLVDQGKEIERVHDMLGKKIAECNPDVVVLMDNNVRNIIENSLFENKFTGKLKIESDPLEFYTNLEHQIAKGDVVLMQNDWTDNYN